MKFSISCTFIAFVMLMSVNSIHLQAGAQAQGTGGFHAAYAPEASTAGFNPALLIDVGDSWDVSGGFVQQDGHIKVSNSSVPGANGKFSSTKIKFWPLLDFGISKLVKPNLAVGLTTRPLGQFIKVTFKRPVPIYGTTKLGVELDIAPIIPTIAYKVGKHSFGLGVGIVLLRFKTKGFENFIPFSLAPDHVTNRGYGYSRGVNLSFGYKLQLTPCFALGAAYTIETRMSRINKYKGFIPDHGRLNIPGTLDLGMAFQVNPRLLLTADLEVAYFGLVRAFHNSPFSQAPLGSKKGAGNGLRNRVYYNAGMEYLLTDTLKVRCGYIYERIPVPRKYTSGNAGASLQLFKHAICGGATWYYNNWQFSVGVIHALRNTLHGRPVPANLGGETVDLTHEVTVVDFGVRQEF